MSGARDAVLRNIRRSLGVPGDDAQRRSAVDARLASPPRGTTPSRAGGTDAARVDLLASLLEEASSTVARVAELADVAAEVATFLKRHNLPQAVRLGVDPLLGAVDWSATPHLERKTGAAAEPDQASVAAAFAGIAESGTLMLTSGPDNPTTNNFLPENHIVVLPHSRVHGVYEDAWDALRAATGGGEMPRTVNYVSGPSRTGDIEQKLQLGAHGPRRLHVILVEGA